MRYLEIPCSYQGGKQRLAEQIVDIIGMPKGNFYDLCCGSGAISLSLINRGFNPNKLYMVDKGEFGLFYRTISDDTFDLDLFEKVILDIPNVNDIQDYLKGLSKKDVDIDLEVYHYLIMQAGAFGGKQLWREGKKWCNCSFRSYWQPTETSNRRSPVMPMFPMPKTLYGRVKVIKNKLGGKIHCYNGDIKDFILTTDFSEKDVIYIDPPYKATTGYGFNLDIQEIIQLLYGCKAKVYISECVALDNCDKNILLSKGRKKGNVIGYVKKKPIEEWLNIL